MILINSTAWLLVCHKSFLASLDRPSRGAFSLTSLLSLTVLVAGAWSCTSVPAVLVAVEAALKELSPSAQTAEGLLCIRGFVKQRG